MKLSVIVLADHFDVLSNVGPQAKSIPPPPTIHLKRTACVVGDGWNSISLRSFMPRSTLTLPDSYLIMEHYLSTGKNHLLKVPAS